MGHGNPKLYMRWPINANARRINLNLKEMNRPYYAQAGTARYAEIKFRGCAISNTAAGCRIFSGIEYPACKKEARLRY